MTNTTDEIKYDKSAKRAGRWATTTSILALFAIVIYAAFVDQMALRLGIPAWLGYGLAGLSAILTLALNAGMGRVSKPVYGKLVAGFIAALAIQTVLMCVFSYIDDKFSPQSLGAMGTTIILFLLAALSAWRLKVMVARI